MVEESRAFSAYVFQLFGSTSTKRPMILILRSPRIPVETGFQNLWSNEVFDGRRLVGERTEHEPVERRHTQLSRTVILYPEVGWHTTLALYAALERHRLQIAAKVITPGMVNALKIFGPLARVIEAD